MKPHGWLNLGFLLFAALLILLSCCIGLGEKATDNGGRDIERGTMTTVNRPTTTAVKIIHTTTTVKRSTTTTTIKKQEIFASISSFSMNYENRQAKFKIRVANTGKINFDDDVKFELHINREKGHIICEECTNKYAMVYTEEKTFRQYLNGLEPRKSREFEFIYKPEIYGQHEYFAEILHGNKTLDKTKAYYFEHKKLV